MSRDSLGEELRPKDADSERQSYLATGLPYDPQLLEGIVAPYLDGSLGRAFQKVALDTKKNSRALFNVGVQEVSDLLDRYATSGLHTLLDAVVGEIRQKGKQSCGSPHLVLDTLIQGLYNDDCNNFSLNLEGITLPVSTLCSRLKGTEGNPLALTFLGGPPVTWFGVLAQYCDFTFQGQSTNIGFLARYTTFRCTESDTGIAGRGSEYCTFHIHSALAIPATTRNCVYYVSDEVHQEDLADLMDDEAGFFENDNVILTPDGQGEWKEVTP